MTRISNPSATGRDNLFTLAGTLAGVRIGLPFLLSAGVTGMVMGVTYRELHIEFAHALLLSAFVFSGTAQAVTATMLTLSPLPLAAMALALVGVNARYFVMSAHLRHAFPELGLRTMLPTLFLLVDPGWLVVVTRAEAGRRDMGLLLGVGLVNIVGWVAGTAIGHQLGLAPSGAVAAGAAFLPLGLLIAVTPSQWRGRATMLPWSVAAALAIAALPFVAPAWAALLGAAVGTAVSARSARDA